MTAAIADFFCVHKKFLVFNLTLRNLRIKYRRSVLGYFWSLLVPLAQAGVYYLVFKVVMNVQVENYVPQILSGVLFWTFFANTIGYGMDGLISNHSLLTKIPIPIQIFPFVETVTNLIALAAALPVLVAVLIWSGIGLSPFFFLSFFYLGVIALIAYGFAIVLSVDHSV